MPADLPQDRVLASAVRPAATIPRLCVAVGAETVEALLQTSAALLPEHAFQEFRLDYLADPEAALPAVGAFVAEHAEPVFLATCRPVRSGGRYQGSAEDELRILTQAAEAGFRFVDLSLESAEELGQEAVRFLQHRGTKVLVSFHDFEATGAMAAVLERMRGLRPNLSKIVPTARNLEDSLALLKLLDVHRNAGAPALVAMAMGEPGVMTRVLGPRFGSAFTFAAATEAETTAPGQVTARALRDLYRIDEISPSTGLYGVAGDPIRASLSPLMLNTAFGEAGMDAVYVPLKTSSAEELFRVANALPLEGFSVTMPLKQKVLPFLSAIDPLAVRIGAVNTVHRQADGTFRGFNTDVAGIVNPLEQRLSLRGARVLVLGAGGAARAAVFACADRGAQVFILNRTTETAVQLAEAAGARVLAREDLAQQDFDVVIHGTPAGMRGQPTTLPSDFEALRAKLVFDLVYNPLETPLLAQARERGCEVIRGVEMFVHQGARQFEIWTGRPAPWQRMQEAVLQYLAARG